jgi:uncharacterized membrane protein YhiD involved in acid resistance
MFEQIFGQEDYYSYPSFEVALFSLLLSFVLSAVIGLVYWFTYSGKNFPNHFFQAIVMSSTVSSMVIMAVGNNLAAGFGIIGAIAIIRFRTLIRDPRNIIFIFASLSIGIATGVYGYAIAIAGTIIFCAVAISLHFSSFGSKSLQIIELSISVKDPEDITLFEQHCKQKGIKYEESRFRKNDVEQVIRFTFKIRVPLDFDTKSFFHDLNSFQEFVDVRLDVVEEGEL